MTVRETWYFYVSIGLLLIGEIKVWDFLAGGRGRGGAYFPSVPQSPYFSKGALSVVEKIAGYFWRVGELLGLWLALSALDIILPKIVVYTFEMLL